jgi:hypothetical protein
MAMVLHSLCTSFTTQQITGDPVRVAVLQGAENLALGRVRSVVKANMQAPSINFQSARRGRNVCTRMRSGTRGCYLVHRI